MSEAAVATALKMDHQPIMIKGNSTNRNIMPTLDNYSAFDELWINVGEEGGPAVGTWARIELFTARRKILPNPRDWTSGEG